MAASAYREALDGAEPADCAAAAVRLARSAVMSGDLDTAAAALDGLDTDGGADDADILLARGKYAFFTSDFEARRPRARRRSGWCSPASATGRCSTSSRCRGCWPTGRGTGSTGCARAAPDAGEPGDRQRHLRRLPLPGRVHALRPDAVRRGDRGRPRPAGDRRRSGALRAAAFASALIGEAALLSGDLELAAAELTEASDLHRDLGSAAGEAHSLQRLAEVRVAEGDDAEAMRLLQQALPLARARSWPSTCCSGSSAR